MPRGPGRPSKQELASTNEMTKREQSAALKAFRARLLLNPKSERLIEKLFDIAFDDEHRQQSVALKILSDRIMPVAGFTADGKQQAKVLIEFSGIGVDDSNASVVIDNDSGDVVNVED